MAWVTRTGAIASVAGITNWKGAWVTSTSYNVGDGVSQSGSSYVCILAHTSGAASQPGIGGSWATYWNVIASKGDPGPTGATGPTGPQGPQGPTGSGTGDMLRANNLSDVLSASTSRTNIGAAPLASPTFTTNVTINGSLNVKQTALGSAYTILDTDCYILADTGGGGFTVTLPTAVAKDGRIYIIKKTGANTLTVACNGAQTIDGSTTKSLTGTQCLIIVSDGSNWKQLLLA